MTLGARRAAIGGLALAGIPLLVLCGALLAGDPILQSVAMVFFINLIAVVGIGVYTGNTGIVSFGHTGFMAIGAYASAILTLPDGRQQAQLTALPTWLADLELSIGPAIAAGAIASVAVAIIVGIAVARLAEAAASIATLGFLVIVYTVLNASRDLTRGSQALSGFAFMDTLWIAGGLACICLFVARLFADTRIGLAARAAREDAPAASAIGINVLRTRYVCWVVSAGFAGLAGALMGHYLGVIAPRTFYFSLTFTLLAMLICGGMRTVTGAVAGALAISILTELLRRAESGLTIGAIELPEVLGLTTLGVAVAILLCLYRLPNGIAGRSEIDASLPFLRHLATPARATPEPAEEAAGIAQTSREPLLAVTSISKRFGGVDAVSQVSLTVRPGQILGILGANGAGKSTLLALIGGSLPVDGGQIVLTGRDVTRAPSHTRARMGLARTFQSIRLFSYLSVRENIRAASVAAGDRGGAADAHADRLMDLLDLTERADIFAAELEYGAQRRLEIARALAMRPKIVLLDEPAAGMNTAETEALGETLLDLRAKLGLAIVLVEHDVAFVTRLSDTIMVLDKGDQIAAGPPDAVLNDPRVIEAYIGRSTADQPAEWRERTAARTVPAQTL